MTITNSSVIWQKGATSDSAALRPDLCLPDDDSGVAITLDAEITTKIRRRLITDVTTLANEEGLDFTAKIVAEIVNQTGNEVPDNLSSHRYQYSQQTRGSLKTAAAANVD